MNTAKTAKKIVVKAKFYSDPGHGWLAVKRKVLMQYVELSSISSYSYQRGQTVYLEEDRDSHIFQCAVLNQGHELSVKEKSIDKYSPIRSYETFKA